jgi:flagellar motor switch protein FliN/FliY
MAAEEDSAMSTEDEFAAAMAEQLQAEKQASVMPFQEFDSTEKSAEKKDNSQPDLDFILDIPIQMTVELGRTKITIKNLLHLAQGSVVELDGMAGEPMDVLVNGFLIAQGEVVVVNDKFGIRMTDIITPAERVRKLNR